MAVIQKISESSYNYLKIEDNTLDDVDSSFRLNGDRFKAHDAPCYGLGALDKLPLEIIHLTLLRLDLQSLTDFRRVNKNAKLMIDSIPQYKLILAHAPASIRGSLNVKTARFFSCLDLYEKLSTAECDSCGDFGGYLYLITCRRVCFLCFTEKIDYLPIPRRDVIRKFGLSSEHLATLPRMQSFPGRYSPRGIKCRRRETLFDYSTARQTAIAIHGSVRSMEVYASEMATQRLVAYTARLARCGTPGASSRPPRSQDPFDGQCSNPRRFMGIVRAPFFNIQTASPDLGFHCVACKPHHYHRPLHWRRKFTEASFSNHVMECGIILDEKHIPPMSQGKAPMSRNELEV